METRWSTEEEEEEEGHEVFNIRTPTCKGHPVGLMFQLTMAGETGLHIQQQTFKTNKKPFKNIVLPGCSR